MSEFYVIRTIHGHRYLYKERRQRGMKPVSICLGRVDGGGRAGLGLAIFGTEDEYENRRDSLWNRYVNKAPEKEPDKNDEAPREEGPKEGAENGEESDSSK